MASVSGLSPAHRAAARKEIVAGARLMLAHRDQVNYSQGADRWEGITHKLTAVLDQYPHHSDCSSSATWLIWQATRPYGLHDIVNGTGWASGFTGTICQHGRTVTHDANIKVGDLILYGAGLPYEHVAVAMGGGMVFSHGSQAGPFLCRMDYRPDRKLTKRFL